MIVKMLSRGFQESLWKASMKTNFLFPSCYAGAVYKAADLTQGFKVKRFLVKDMNIFPIDVSCLLVLELRGVDSHHDYCIVNRL